MYFVIPVVYIFVYPYDFQINNVHNPEIQPPLENLPIFPTFGIGSWVAFTK
jgi:hypothetical protein